MKNRLTALLLALILCGSLAACGGGQNTSAEDKQENETVDTVKGEENKDTAEDETSDKSETEADKDTAVGSETADNTSQSKPQSGSTASGTNTGSSAASKPQSGGSTSSGSGSSSSGETGNTSSGSTSTSKPESTTTPAPQPEPEPEPAQPTAAQASGYIGSSASALEGALGSPSSKSYSPSCMGEGEDGVWTYSGFTVYTYRENGVETVEAVS